MPLHDFRCRGCGHQFEALVRPADTGAPSCPACGRVELERLLSGFAVGSAEKTRGSADKARKRAAAIGRQETMAAEREMTEHRREDH